MRGSTRRKMISHFPCKSKKISWTISLSIYPINNFMDNLLPKFCMHYYINILSLSHIRVKRFHGKSDYALRTFHQPKSLDGNESQPIVIQLHICIMVWPWIEQVVKVWGGSLLAWWALLQCDRVLWTVSATAWRGVHCQQLPSLFLFTLLFIRACFLNDYSSLEIFLHDLNLKKCEGSGTWQFNFILIY